MPRYVDGLPVIENATDAKDSAFFAGTLAWLGLKEAPDLRLYFLNGLPVRHPTEQGANIPEQFSRDQMIMLASGLAAQGLRGDVASMYHRAVIAGHKAPNHQADEGHEKLFGGDLMTPQHMNHLRLCAKMDGETNGYDWLVKDIKFNARYTPLRESNQLVAMCCMAGPEYVEMYKKVTPVYREAITSYWCGWRNEPEVAEAIIRKLEAYK